MFSKVKGFAFVAGALALGFVGATSDANAQLVYRTPVLIMGTQVAISCQNPGSHQDVSKTPILKNTSGAMIPKGKTLAWKSSDGDKGTVKLDADMPVNGTITAMGQAGNGYTCTSSFTTSADLAITAASLTPDGKANFTIQNLDKWVDAPNQVVRFEVVSCSGNAVLASVDSSAFPMAKLSGKSISLPIAPTSGKRYVRVKADALGQVGEFNETNNVYAPMDTCVY